MESRKKLAEELLDTLHRGSYRVDGRQVMIPTYLPATYYPESCLSELQEVPERPVGLDKLDIRLLSCSTVDAVIDLAGRSDTIGVLNFASAMNPGGGFVSGAMAQEEALCHASTLYYQLATSPMYEDNQKANLSGLYNDSMNVSTTYFIKDGKGAFIKPVSAVVISSAAVNRHRGVPLSDDVVRRAMRIRMERILQMFARYGRWDIVLGAFGCGVFGNDPKMVAELWVETLIDYSGWFKSVTFAVLDRDPVNGPNIRAFADVLGSYLPDV